MKTKRKAYHKGKVNRKENIIKSEYRKPDALQSMDSVVEQEPIAVRIETNYATFTNLGNGNRWVLRHWSKN